MRIVVTGAGGMLGQDLVRTLGSRHQVFPFTHGELNVTQLREVRAAISGSRPDWVVHAAAYTAVDRAEREADSAFLVNALGTRNTAIAAREAGASILFFSTDYVFDGRRQTPYSEWDDPNPLNTYGKSKLAGEREVQSLCPDHLIVRTSWLFGKGGDHFPGKILERAGAGQALRVIDDQVGIPTYTPDLAAASLGLIELQARGICNVTNTGSCSWYELARETLKVAGVDASITPVSTEDFPTAAIRPAYSVLGNYCLRAWGVAPLRSWQEAVKHLLDS